MDGRSTSGTQAALPTYKEPRAVGIGQHGRIVNRRRPFRELPYPPGIDGVRALAVTAVVLYHADVRWMPAGFLGVDGFFVISGYLICSLLVAEWHRTGTISLRQFWMRRARRLLPALAVLLVGVTVAAPLAPPPPPPPPPADHPG